MMVCDLNGDWLEITNLNSAIYQAKLFSTYKHLDKAFKSFDEKQKTYWSDLYTKLISLKKAH